MMFTEEEKPNYARHKLLREKPDVPLSVYIYKSFFGPIPSSHARLNVFEELTRLTSQQDNTMSNEKIEVRAYNPITLQANKDSIEDYLQSKNSTFFKPVSPTPRFGWGNYAEFVDWNKSHASDEPSTKRGLVK